MSRLLRSVLGLNILSVDALVDIVPIHEARTSRWPARSVCWKAVRFCRFLL